MGAPCTREPRGRAGAGDLASPECKKAKNDIVRTLIQATSSIVLPDVDVAQRTVLIIDDNAKNVELMTGMLRRRPYIRALSALSPEQGIELARTIATDLIVLDINMPGLNGYQALAAVKGEARLATVPVLAVTANASAHEAIRMRAAGFTDYLIKPLDLPQFQSVVDRLLEPGPRRQ